MNQTRRKDIANLKDRLEELAASLEDLRTDLENIRDEEQDYYDNMPESIQAGEKGDRAMAAIDSLDAATSEFDAIDFDQIVSYLEEAAE